MFTRRRQYVCVRLVGLLLLLCGGSNVLYAPHYTDWGSHINIGELTENADFVFKGQVTKIQYLNSDIVPLFDQAGGQIRDEEDNLVFESTSDMPHTFVTYNVVEIFRGLLPTGGASTLTVRFMGGLSTSDPETVAAVSGFPLFDVGDVDVLFVNGNTFLACPLMDCEHGRLRAMLDPKDPTQTLRMYNENGFEIVHLNQTADLHLQNIGLGPSHEIPDVLTHQIGSSGQDGIALMELLGEGNEENDFADNPGDSPPESPIVLGPHFTADDFAQFLHAVVFSLPPYTGPPVVSANPLQSFSTSPVKEWQQDDDGHGFIAQEPGEFEKPERPWLTLLPPDELAAILAAEAKERQLVEEAGGDPVIPETPCDQQITGVSHLIADISGPDDKPDCRVDLFDFEKLAELYLSCNDPVDPLCL
jgi:hypothetical protein